MSLVVLLNDHSCSDCWVNVRVYRNWEPPSHYERSSETDTTWSRCSCFLHCRWTRFEDACHPKTRQHSSLLPLSALSSNFLLLRFFSSSSHHHHLPSSGLHLLIHLHHLPVFLTILNHSSRPIFPGTYLQLICIRLAQVAKRLLSRVPALQYLAGRCSGVWLCPAVPPSRRQRRSSKTPAATSTFPSNNLPQSDSFSSLHFSFKAFTAKHQAFFCARR